MTSTLEEMRAIEQRQKDMRAARRKREQANRVATNLKPHLKNKVWELAEENHVVPRAMIRILLCEALEARGINLNKLHKAWKESNPNEVETEDE